MTSRPQTTHQSARYRNLSQDNEMTVVSGALDFDRMSTVSVPYHVLKF